MSTTVLTGVISDADGFVSSIDAPGDEDFVFTLSSFTEATGTNDEAITIDNGAGEFSTVTLAGTAIGNRVGVELDGSDTLLITSTGLAYSERAFGVRTLNADNTVVVAGFVGGADVGVELDGDRDRLTITGTGTVSGVEDPEDDFRPAGVNLRGDNTILENHGTIIAGTLANGDRPAVTNRESIFSDSDLDATVINSGAIFGDVLLADGEDVYDATGGGVVNGRIDLGGGNDIFRGGNIDEEAFGGDGQDLMQGGAGADILNGEGGNDTLEGGPGADVLNGGAGNDRATYENSVAAVAIDLQSGIAVAGDAGSDTLIGIEFLTGSAGDDFLFGDAAPNSLLGGTGDDGLFGRDGNDALRGDAGADMINGGNGNDTAFYNTSSAGVNVNLQTGVGIGGDAQGDTLALVENLVGSGSFDALFGNGAANSLAGGGGNDIIAGGGGSDLIDGGTGNDMLGGGMGSDVFVRRPNEGVDMITDFADNIDALDLAAFGFANTDAATLGAAQVGPDVVFTFDTGDTLTVQTILFAALQDDIII